jgi:acyl-CoA reductase-like NAD-dependent aldehyde dehydrogenase
MGEGRMTLMTPPIADVGLLIGAERIAETSAGTATHHYAGNGRPTAAVPLGGAAEIDHAVRSAREALPTWLGLGAGARRTLMLRFADLVRANAAELGRICAIESGVPISGAARMPLGLAEWFTYNAGWADKVGGEVVPLWQADALDYTLDEPYGVIAVIIPWNGPVIAAGMTLGPALAAGNCVILKPAELAPFGCLRIGELLLEAGFPPGVVNVVPGGPAAGEALVGHPDVDKVHFTGSRETARRVMTAAAVNTTPVGLELGGKSALLVFEDCDLDAAVRQAVGGIVRLAGQGCVNNTRVLVSARVQERFVAACSEAVRQIHVGDPLEPQTVMGPVITASARDRILAMIERARGAGGRLVAGGDVPAGVAADGYYVAPTVFDQVDPECELAQQEVFGPVLAILPFGSEDEAVAIANGTEYGLGAYVHTRDLRRAHRLAARLVAGNVWVNSELGPTPQMPFGGVKGSGFGRLGGRDGIREFTRTKNVWIGL